MDTSHRSETVVLDRRGYPDFWRVNGVFGGVGLAKHLVQLPVVFLTILAAVTNEFAAGTEQKDGVSGSCSSTETGHSCCQHEV